MDFGYSTLVQFQSGTHKFVLFTQTLNDSLQFSLILASGFINFCFKLKIISIYYWLTFDNGTTFKFKADYCNLLHFKKKLL